MVWRPGGCGNRQRRRVRLVMDTDDWEGAGGWNDVAPYSRWQKRFFAWQERWGMTHCHRLTVASRALQAWAQGMPASQVIYLPNGPGIAVPDATTTNRRAQLGWRAAPRCCCTVGCLSLTRRG